MNYESWYEHIRNTRIDKTHHGIKIYKHLLLLIMLKRGKNNWWKPIAPEEVALPFYRILTDNKKIRDLSFSDKSNIQHWYHYDEKFISSLIEKNPMKHWGEFSSYRNGRFSFNLVIPIIYRDEVYQRTKNECINRITNELGFEIDTRIDLKEEYDYYRGLSNNLFIAESEKDVYIKQKLIQGKFKNRLFEKYDKCLICGIENKKLLTGCYIKPWRVCNSYEKFDVNNGLILCPNHDKLFERGYISFSEEGILILSSALEQFNDNKKLLIDMEINRDFSSENYMYLNYHRNNIFIK